MIRALGIGFVAGAVGYAIDHENPSGTVLAVALCIALVWITSRVDAALDRIPRREPR